MDNHAKVAHEAKVAPSGPKPKKRRRKPAPPADLRSEVQKLEDAGELPPGFSLEKKTYTEVHRDGTSVEVGHDLVLCCDFQGRTWFCGRTANWQSKSSLVFDPFQDVITPKSRVAAADHARAAAWGIFRAWELEAGRLSEEKTVVDKEITVAKLENPARLPKTARQVQWRTTLEETRVLDSILQACRQGNVEVNGKPVTTYVDVVRYVFKQLGE